MVFEVNLKNGLKIHLKESLIKRKLKTHSQMYWPVNLFFSTESYKY